MEIIIFIVFGFALLLVTDNSRCRRRKIGYGTMPITKRPKVRPRPQK